MVAWIVAAAALSVAAFFCALWLGERGRRLDVQWVTQTLRPRGATEAKPAFVVEPDPERAASSLIAAEGREQLIRDIMAETGVSRRKAEAEADRIIAEVNRVG
ncbi:MAG TPA: hypothetical protein VIL25_06015, partial [Vicinamibacterales bacterium]